MGGCVAAQQLGITITSDGSEDITLHVGLVFEVLGILLDQLGPPNR